MLFGEVDVVCSGGVGRRTKVVVDEDFEKREVVAFYMRALGVKGLGGALDREGGRYR